ncbi:MAG: DUF3575 domain-containing protein [Saprospiraceae bacterium]|nr:DUF3575 domain-containing protein [Saprospiraceae bacterium]
MLEKLLLTLLFFTSLMLSAQEKQKNFIIKTNVLNAFIIPSVHLEFKLADKSSVVLNFHRGNLIFFNEKNWINASIDFKKYFSSKTNLTGFYLSPGISYNYDYDEVKLDYTGNVLKYGTTNIGGIVRVGYQFGLNNHWIIDLGTGVVIDKEIESYYDDKIKAELRLMAGVGYKF